MLPFAAPDFELYTYSAQAQFLYYWHHPSPFQPHVAIEIDRVAPLPLKTALYQMYKRPHNEIDTTETLRWAWQGIAQRAKLRVLYAPSMPIGENPLLTPLLDKATMLRATAHNLDTGKDLFPNDTFLTLQQMCTESAPTAMDTLLYYQIRAACKSRFVDFPQAPPTLPALENVLSTPSPRKLVTRIYRITQSESPIITANAKADWERDIGMDITDEQWRFCCTQLEHLSPN